MVLSIGMTLLKLNTIVSPGDLGLGKAKGVSVSSGFKSKNLHQTNKLKHSLFLAHQIKKNTHIYNKKRQKKIRETDNTSPLLILIAQKL